MNIYHYEGWNKRPAKCGLEYIRQKDSVMVVLTELNDNPGTSVTNMVEHLATMIFNEHLKDDYTPEQVQWVEHYPDRGGTPEHPMFAESWDMVTMKWDGEKFSKPEWKHLKNPPYS